MKRITWQWRQINSQNIPNKPGIYAWYYRIVIGQHDIEEFIGDLSEKISVSDRREFIRDFLLRNIFSYFEEAPYQAILAGKLKARYEGTLEHKQCVTDNLIERLLQNPKQIIDVRNILQESSCDFSSPLYIGMASNLRSRLIGHKSLIEKYGAEGSTEMVPTSDEEAASDHNFAWRIVERKFIETNLFVVLRQIGTKNSLHNTLENMLNRINYPVLGRN